MAEEPHAVAASWLTAFTFALEEANLDALRNLFLPDGWFRDILVFSWDVRSLEGRDRIQSYLTSKLSEAQISSVELRNDQHFSPHASFLPLIQTHDVEFGFKFGCRRGGGEGYTRLVRDTDGTYRAWSAFMMLSYLYGHEELSTLHLRDDVTGVPGRDMQKEFTRWVSNVEAEPYVLIVGGGQTGLQVAARFKQMDIPALVVERNARIGDGWRKRYPSLTLHTPRRHHSLLYQSYPSNWPDYTPRDKLADWLEHYAMAQDLVVWTSSELRDRPIYDPEKQQWNLTITREGKQIQLRPTHIVLATGTLGKPNVPSVPGQDLFRGTVFHSHQYAGPTPFVNKRVVVVGAGNTSIDICQDCVLRGAKEVTMVQRSSTCVLGRDFVGHGMREGWPEDVPVEVSDLRWASIPFGLHKKMAITAHDYVVDVQKELHDKLRKGGLQLTMGAEGEGLYIMTLGRFGGFWQDKGGADLIANGKIQVKSGVTMDHFTETGIVFNDGSELVADAVVFATGYLQIRDTNRELFGDEIIGDVGPVYGMDTEGEIQGSYRPSGHPGLWFATGDFFLSRFMSKVLALQVKARQLGLID